MKKAIVWVLVAVVATILAVNVINFPRDGGRVASNLEDGRVAEGFRLSDDAGESAETQRPEESPEADADQQEDESEENDEPQTEEEKREAAEEAKVDAFDNLTDKWMEASEKGVAMADVDNFVKQFRQIPKSRQDECIHRALNLIPDENVMLLAGILMDKTADKEIVETVYNDILNRDEDVKKPILQQIFKDKSHPCWADTAWILDVTDELPKKN